MKKIEYSIQILGQAFPNAYSDSIEWLAYQAEEEYWQYNNRLFQENIKADSIYIIRNGKVNIQKSIEIDLQGKSEIRKVKQFKKLGLQEIDQGKIVGVELLYNKEKESTKKAFYEAVCLQAPQMKVYKITKKKLERIIFKLDDFRLKQDLRKYGQQKKEYIFKRFKELQNFEHKLQINQNQVKDKFLKVQQVKQKIINQYSDNIQNIQQLNAINNFDSNQVNIDQNIGSNEKIDLQSQQQISQKRIESQKKLSLHENGSKNQNNPNQKFYQYNASQQNLAKKKNSISFINNDKTADQSINFNNLEKNNNNNNSMVLNLNNNSKNNNNNQNNILNQNSQDEEIYENKNNYLSYQVFTERVRQFKQEQKEKEQKLIKDIQQNNPKELQKLMEDKLFPQQNQNNNNNTPKQPSQSVRNPKLFTSMQNEQQNQKQANYFKNIILNKVLKDNKKQLLVFDQKIYDHNVHIVNTMWNQKKNQISSIENNQKVRNNSQVDLHSIFTKRHSKKNNTDIIQNHSINNNINQQEVSSLEDIQMTDRSQEEKYDNLPSCRNLIKRLNIKEKLKQSESNQESSEYYSPQIKKVEYRKDQEVRSAIKRSNFKSHNNLKVETSMQSSYDSQKNMGLGMQINNRAYTSKKNKSVIILNNKGPYKKSIFNTPSIASQKRLESLPDISQNQKIGQNNNQEQNKQQENPFFKQLPVNNFQLQLNQSVSENNTAHSNNNLSTINKKKSIFNANQIKQRQQGIKQIYSQKNL